MKRMNVRTIAGKSGERGKEEGGVVEKEKS